MPDYKYRSVGLELTTANQDAYTAPPQWNAEVTSILVSNMLGSPVTVSMDWYDSLNTTYYTMLENVSIPAYGIFQLTDSLHLSKNDKIRALCSMNTAVTLTVRTSEYKSTL